MPSRLHIQPPDDLEIGHDQRVGRDLRVAPLLAAGLERPLRDRILAPSPRLPAGRFWSALMMCAAACVLQMGPAQASEPDNLTAEQLSPDPPAPPLTSAAADTTGSAEPEAWNMQGQFTFVEQRHPSFRSPYQGAHSLTPSRNGEETADLTLFAGVRLWRGGAFYMNPEVDQGFGLSNTLGVAGFPSGEAYKVGQASPYLRLQRAFVRQRFDLGGDPHVIVAGPNELGGAFSADSVTLTAGKSSVVDVFDANAYAHDPRADFLNWSIIDAAAFDYAADAWGYTVGAAAEWTRGWWTLRGGVFELSNVPNSTQLERGFKEFALIGELEDRYELQGHPGKVRLLGFVNNGWMGAYDAAVSLGQSSGTTPDTASVRKFASRPGFVVNLEQELGPEMGAFARLSFNDGSKEANEFTDVNKSLSLGVVLKGGAWSRAAEAVGVAAAFNGISAAARRHFFAGGLGILIGDGQLPHAGTENIVELFYSMHIVEHLTVSADYQYIVNPSYNQDRGPVSIFALRLHAEM